MDTGIEQVLGRLRDLEAQLHAGEFFIKHAPQHRSGGQDPLPSSNLIVTEVDGNPSVSGVSTVKFSNGTVTDNGDGSVTVSTGSAASGGTPALVLANSNSAGVAATFIRTDDQIRAFDTTAPTNSAMGDVAAVGTVAWAARRDHLHGRESFATPAIVLGTAAAAGVATTPIRSDGTIVAFDVTVPVTQTLGDSAATGAAAVAARRDHKHGMFSTVAHGSITTSGLKVSVSISAQAFRAALTNGPSYALTESTTNKVMIPVLDFDDTTAESAMVLFMLPDNYNAAVSMTAQFIWTSASGSNGVTWSIAALVLADDDAIDTAFPAATTVSDTVLANGDVHISAATAGFDPGTSDGAGRPCWIKVARVPSDGSDTKVGDARLIAVRLEFEINSLSS